MLQQFNIMNFHEAGLVCAILMYVMGQSQPKLLRSSVVQHSHRNISIVGDEFVLDGQPLRIVSGSVHYFQIPDAYWRDRLRKLKAVGANCVSTYVEWRFHELEERQYSFVGDRNVTEFIRIAAEEGLFVLLRPGPYIDAERDLGGLPYWLYSKYPKMQQRTIDKDFISETKTWLAKVFEHVTPLLYGNGGPIILVQVENEYGIVGNDKVYKKLMRDIILEHVGNNALLYTTDNPGLFSRGAIEGTLSTIDFGAWESHQRIKGYFNNLRDFMSKGPLMCSEFYVGWQTLWSDKSRYTINATQVVDILTYLLEMKININLYMFHGGTNFEFDAGAYIPNNNFKPVTTSYDFDAPLTEAGDPTPKYYAIRNTLEKYHPEVKNIPVPISSPKLAHMKIALKPRTCLLSSEGRMVLGKKHNAVTGSTLPTFEKLRQRAGLVLYETTLNHADGELEITKPHDRVYVYVDGILTGVIERMTKRYKLKIQCKRGSTISLLVENQARICSSGYLSYEFKGILSPVKYNNDVLDGKWTITGYPLETINISDTNVLNTPSLKKGPILYEADFTLSENQDALDTYLDPRGWGKGYVWVNGHNLGRYWPGKGPQVTLYVPGCWLHAAPHRNHLQVLELEAVPRNLTVELIDHPIIN